MSSQGYRVPWQILGLVVLLAAGAGYMTFHDKSATFAVWKDADIGEVRVIGRSQDRFEGWGARLCWRKGAGPWAVYYMGHQGAYWLDVQVIREDRMVIVMREGTVVGRLDTHTGAFQYVPTGMAYAHPLLITHDEEPSYPGVREVYPDTPGWASVWPGQFLGPAETGKGDRR